MPLVSVVVPVYHNAASLPDLYSRLAATAAGRRDETFEFIFVDDGSRDDSFAVLEALAQSDARIRLVKLARNFGSNPAVLAGLGQTRGDAVAIISADLQDPPELIGEMAALWKAGRKLVVAARASRGDPLSTRLTGKLFYALFRRGAMARMPAGGFDFCLFDRQIRDYLVGLRERSAYLPGEILWPGFEPAVIPYERAARPRKYGRSMWTVARRLRYFIDAFAGFTALPLRAATVAGLAALALGLPAAVCALIAPGSGIVLAVVLILAGVQLLSVGVLGEYQWRALENSRGRPPFIIERTVEPKGPQSP